MEQIKSKIRNIHETKKSNVIVSVDLTDTCDILGLIRCIGRDVLGIKLHSDIIVDDNENESINEFYSILKEVKEQYNFIVIEDRKFCDIGNTVKLQSQKLDYADLITVHSLPGPGIISGLRENCLKQNVGILLIAEMSSSGNLITPEYTKRTVELAENNTDVVVGFICQNRLPSTRCPEVALLTSERTSDFLYFSPGVKLQQSKVMCDNLGQSYTSPQTLKNRGIDYMIVGRGITESNIPNVMIKMYQQEYDNSEVHSQISSRDDSREVLKKCIIEKGIIKHGDFVLSSGEKSNLYADFRLLTGFPSLMLKVAHEFDKLCTAKGLTPENSVLMGIPMGGIALSSSISFVTNIPMVIVREKRKEYGSKNLIEGMNVEELRMKRVVLIEDVITTGNSIGKTIELLKKEENVKVSHVLCILDREKGGRETLEDKYNVCVNSLYLLSQIE